MWQVDGSTRKNTQRYYTPKRLVRKLLEGGSTARNYLWWKYFLSSVPLDSIPEFPAETSEEINASEDGKAKSGEYWIYSVITGKTALVSCDMEPEGKNIQVLVVAADMNVKKFV